MPKNQFVCPDNMRKPGFIEFTPIPVNQYDRQGALKVGRALEDLNFTWLEAPVLDTDIRVWWN